MGLGQRFCLLEELEADEAGVGPKEQAVGGPYSYLRFPDFYRFLPIPRTFLGDF